MRSRKAMLNPFCRMLVALFLTLSPICMSVQASQETVQQNGQTETSSPPRPAETPDEKPDDSKPQNATTTSQAMSPGDARQAQFVADSQKLYQLAQELKAEVAKSNKNTLSIAVTKKADEIEKLAKSLKERMRKE